jgi:hypothetical protein
MINQKNPRDLILITMTFWFLIFYSNNNIIQACYLSQFTQCFDNFYDLIWWFWICASWVIWHQNSNHWKIEIQILCETGGFQLLDLIIPELKSHVIPYKWSALIGGKFICKKKSFTRFALQSECCNFNQWEDLNL